jgi:hypothetical protein
MPWTQVRCQSVVGLVRFMLDRFLEGQSRGSPAGFVWRGEPEEYENGIVSRLERSTTGILTGETEDERLDQERRWYDTWWDEIMPIMLPRDLRSPTREDDLPELDWLHFATHHGCHSRLVDWSMSPWTALYFACSRSYGKNGRVWFFDADALERVVGARWDGWGVEQLKNAHGERDIVKAAFTPTPHSWIVTHYNRLAPTRMAAHHGLFTIASRLGEAHDRVLDNLLPEGSKFLLTIPDGDKAGILGYLRSMGVHHESLQYPMLDCVADDIVKNWRNK